MPIEPECGASPPAPMLTCVSPLCGCGHGAWLSRHQREDARPRVLRCAVSAPRGRTPYQFRVGHDSSYFWDAAPCVGALAWCSPHPIPVSGAAKLLMLIVIVVLSAAGSASKDAVIVIIHDREKSPGSASVCASTLGLYYTLHITQRDTFYEVSPLNYFSRRSEDVESGIWLDSRRAISGLSASRVFDLYNFHIFQFVSTPLAGYCQHIICIYFHAKIPTKTMKNEINPLSGRPAKSSCLPTYAAIDS